MTIENSTRLKQHLRRLASASTDCQRQFMEGLARREREPRNGFTSVDELERLGENRPTAVKFFKDLAAAGCGEFLTGRRGQPSRIEWHLKAKEVGQEFVSYLQEVESPAATHQGVDEVSEPVSEDFHRHQFLLRPGVQINIELPLDLTVEESVRLADFVRTLPFHASTSTSTKSHED